MAVLRATLSAIVGLVFIFIETSSSSASVPQSVEDPPLPAPGPPKVPTDYCIYYNGTDCPPGASCPETEQCGPHESEKRNHCFVLWHNTTEGKITVKMKGCFMNSLACYDRPDCIEEVHKPKKDLMFCCCEGNSCNRHFSWLPSEPEPPTLVKVNPTKIEDENGKYAVLVYTLVPLSTLCAAAAVALWVYRRRKASRFNELPLASGSASCPPSPLPLGRALPVSLGEVKARGRFGAVWRGRLQRCDVAVKVFPAQDKQSWLCEQEIFKLPRMNHPDVLRYVGVDKRGDGPLSEYWLVTAYHEKGSLCDYLKANTLTWSEACRIAVTMSRGLTHLHDEVSGVAGDIVKPAIAHRDFKSKNVLLKTDMSACIADFGLALVFQPGKPCGDTHGQVGTRRYMAPEVLEGAINFTRDAFLRIDMYACGLVLWEIASRCVANGDIKTDYVLPFEDEIGSHPTLEEMQDAVVLRKVRPRIGDTWKNHSGLSVLCDTMEECWDHDAEARLSASCVLERISSNTRSTPIIPISYPDTPLLIEDAAPMIDVDSQ